MGFILFDNEFRANLSPLSLTKAVADFHFGLLTIKERWALLLKSPVFVHTDHYLQPLYDTPSEITSNTWIDAAVLPTDELIQRIQQLSAGECLIDEKGLIAGRSSIAFSEFNPSTAIRLYEKKILIDNILRIVFPWDIMLRNDAQIRADFKWVTRGRKSAPISSTVQVFQTADIFIEEGAKLEFCTLNSTTGPIYIGANAEIMEGTSIRGPFSIGYNSVLKLNSRVYGGTTLGPYCMGGGEIKNAVIMGYSNKAHDGYLGDAVIGEWCNLGAGTTNSNLKNSAGIMKVWSMGLNEYITVGQKCGLIMGDFSRLSINSSVNTGSVIGVSCNVFGAGLLPRIIPHFSWGIETIKYRLETAFTDINNWKAMKGKKLSDAEMNMLQHIFQNK